jgi:hypothetical protein
MINYVLIGGLLVLSSAAVVATDLVQIVGMAGLCVGRLGQPSDPFVAVSMLDCKEQSTTTWTFNNGAICSPNNLCLYDTGAPTWTTNVGNASTPLLAYPQDYDTTTVFVHNNATLTLSLQGHCNRAMNILGGTYTCPGCILAMDPDITDCTAAASENQQFKFVAMSKSLRGRD